MNLTVTHLSYWATLWRNSLLLSLSFIASGCSTTQVFQPPFAPSNGNALVYFIRKSYPPYVHEVRLSVNGKAMGTVANNDFIAVNVPVGANRIQLDVTDGKPLSFEIKIEREEKLYVVFTGDVSRTRVTNRVLWYVVDLQWNLSASPVSKSEAESIVAGFGKRFE
jgi:hypothetical protein